MIRPATIMLVVLLSMSAASAYENISPTDSTYIILEAINLSEDMSTLSSKNDELLVLLYSYDDTISIGKPLMKEYFVLDSTVRKKNISNTFPEDITRYLFFLIELDTDRSTDQLEKVVRTHHAKMIDLFTKRDLVELQKLIGDDDLMGFKIFNRDSNKDIAFSFQGRYKLDKYAYRIRITNTK